METLESLPRPRENGHLKAKNQLMGDWLLWFPDNKQRDQMNATEILVRHTTTAMC